MIDDIHLNKAAIIRRCLERVREEYQDAPARLDSFTIQDAIVLNLLRACESAIDLAMHIIAQKKLGVPQSSRDAFAILETAGIIDASCASAMSRMCGFRNIAVHSYQQLEKPILLSVLQNHLIDFENFLNILAKK